MRGMTDQNMPPRSALPHHSLVAYQVAVEFLLAVKRANIRDPKFRDEATRAAKSVCLNAAEGAGRITRADKARAFAIARGEAVEAVAAVELCAIVGDVAQDSADQCVTIAKRLVALLTSLAR